MRIAFLADTRLEDVTESRRIGLLWRALIRIDDVDPIFIAIDDIRSLPLRRHKALVERDEDALDLVLNATNDPNAANEAFPGVPIVWVPPSDANIVTSPQLNMFASIWLWQDGPVCESEVRARQILPDIYDLSLDHSIEVYPDRSILAEPNTIEVSGRRISHWLQPDDALQIGISSELVQSVAECPALDHRIVETYDNRAALARASMVVSDFSSGNRELAVSAVENGAELFPIGRAQDFVLGGHLYQQAHLDEDDSDYRPIDWMPIRSRNIDDLVASVDQELRSVSRVSIKKSSAVSNNTSIECSLHSHSFNPYTRLLIAVVACQGPLVGKLLLDGFAMDRTDKELCDQRCDRISQGGADQSAQLRIVVRVPLDCCVRDISFRVTIEDCESRDILLPDTIILQESGFLSVEPDLEHNIIVEHWAAASRSELHSLTGKVVDTVRTDNRTGLQFLRSTIERGPQDDKLTAIPEAGVGQVLASILNYLEPNDVTSEALMQLKDAYRGKSAWLIGNGPSVRSSDLDRLEGQLCFAFNRFHLAYPNTKLRPQFTLCSDRQTIEDFFEEISASAGGMVLCAQPDMPTGSSAAEWLRVVPVYPPLFSKNPTIRVVAGGSTPFVAMQVAHFLGIRRLYLYGMDFTYRVTPNFDSKDPMRSAIGEGNHFIGDYRAGLPWAPPNTMNILMSFLAAREIFTADGGGIYNATRGGALELFERCDFDQALDETD